MEKVRLVIWDLDETFWRGTLTEGGIDYIRAHHDIVVALARRGIVSSICSRNDHSQVESILRETGLWNYFVFPSIDWSAKGARLKSLVEAAQLRPATVMFIDDNPMNRAEAQHFVDGIQISDPSILSGMLDNELFAGKDDAELTRLEQYKLLERRRQDHGGSADTAEFLRANDIRVWIDHDIEHNLDRAIELINRTNQLNFTKKRLAENQVEARAELRALLSQYDIQAGLIRVTDRYGDYGYCGLYVQSKTIHASTVLIHYCFSCRILGMHIESWLYRRLGRPLIIIAGEVHTNLEEQGDAIDWITLDTKQSERAISAGEMPQISRIFMRGGCELVAVSHYFELLTGSLVGEFAFNRDAVPIRLDHSQLLRLAIDGPSHAEMEALRKLNFQPEDFETAILRGNGKPEIWLLSFWGDVTFPLFRHRELGFSVPLHAVALTGGDNDLTKFDLDAIQPELQNHWIASAIAEIQENYVFDGLIAPGPFGETISKILGRLPQNSRAFVLGAGEKILEPDGLLQDFPRHIELNRRLRDIMGPFPQVTYLDMENYIGGVAEREIREPNHFARQVYFRLFEDVRQRLTDGAR